MVHSVGSVFLRRQMRQDIVRLIALYATIFGATLQVSASDDWIKQVSCETLFCFAVPLGKSNTPTTPLQHGGNVFALPDKSKRKNLPRPGKLNWPYWSRRRRTRVV